MKPTKANPADFDSIKNDEHWITRAVEGDEHAFSFIMREYHRRITALGMSFFKNITDTEDFVQDVFIKTFSNLKSFKGNARFSTWITRIAYNTAINAVNRRKEYASLVNEDIIVDTALNPEEEQLRRISKEALAEAMKDIPEQYVLCLDLYFFHDMPYNEISSVTGLPVNTIKSHIFRAKKLLRDKLIDVIGV
jgi:RNA polymerase sigma-70 factor (ECF subfamily)